MEEAQVAMEHAAMKQAAEEPLELGLQIAPPLEPHSGEEEEVLVSPLVETHQQPELGAALASLESLLPDSAQLIRFAAGFSGPPTKNKMRMSNTCCLCGESSAGQFIWLSSLLRTLQTTWKDRVGVTEQQAADYQALMARMQAIINAADQAPERLSLSVCRACSKYTRLHHKWTDPKDRRLIRPTVNRCSRISEPIVMMRTTTSPLDEWKWESRGQRHISGQPNPRIYYTCKVPGCPARKTLDQDPDGSGQMVIRYYGGEHNHDPPVQDHPLLLPGIPKRRKRDQDENEDGSETHSSRPVGAVAGGGASGGVDALSPPVGTGSVRKHPSGGSDEAQHTQARDTLQIDMGGLNSGHTTVNLEALNGGALPMNGAHATGQNGSSILHMLQNNKKNDTPTYPKTIEVEANSQPLMAQLMQLANQHAAAQAAAAAAAANKKDTDKPPAGQAQPDAPMFVNGAWSGSMINVVQMDPTQRPQQQQPQTLVLETPPQQTPAQQGAQNNTAAYAPATGPSIVVVNQAASNGGAQVFAQAPAGGAQPPSVKAEAPSAPAAAAGAAAAAQAPAQASEGQKIIWQTQPAAAPGAPPAQAASSAPVWGTQILLADGQWLKTSDAGTGDASGNGTWQTVCMPDGTTQTFAAAPQPVAAPPAPAPAQTTYRVGDQVWVLQTPQPAPPPPPPAPVAPAGAIQTNAVIQWQSEDTIIMNGKQWRVVSEVSAPPPPPPPPPQVASQPQWQLAPQPAAAPQWQAVPQGWPQAAAPQVLQMAAPAAVAAPQPQYQVVMVPGPAQPAPAAPVQAPVQPQWLSAAPPAPGAQPAIVWMMPSQ